ncbi:MAG: hypothetical protein AB3N28_13300 [Kordiimonas sp.]
MPRSTEARAKEPFLAQLSNIRKSSQFILCIFAQEVCVVTPSGALGGRLHHSEKWNGENTVRKILTMIVAAAMFGNVVSVAAKAVETSFKFEKGRVLDILYLIRKDNPREAYQRYFKEVGPFAIELGYKPLSGLSVVGKPTTGNIYPDVVAFGTWPGDFEDRASHLKTLMKQVPDLHSRRMDLWSSFNMSWYELTEDITLTIDSEKYYVLSAYWQENEAAFKRFVKAYKSAAASAGGEVVLELTDGQSPFSYMHKPELVLISEWESEQVFKEFHARNAELNHKALKHATEFPINRLVRN